VKDNGMTPLTAPTIGTATPDVCEDRISQRAAIWLMLGVSAVAWAGIGWLLSAAL